MTSIGRRGWSQAKSSLATKFDGRVTLPLADVLERVIQLQDQVEELTRIVTLQDRRGQPDHRAARPAARHLLRADSRLLEEPARTAAGRPSRLEAGRRRRRPQDDGCPGQGRQASRLPPRTRRSTEARPPERDRRPVVVDLQALQSPDFRGRGIARYAYRARGRPRAGPPRARLPLPAEPRPAAARRSRAPPRLGKGRLRRRCPALSSRLLHVLSPFELEVPIDRVWPGGPTNGGLRFCATVYDLIPLEHPHTYLGRRPAAASLLGPAGGATRRRRAPHDLPGDEPVARREARHRREQAPHGRRRDSAAIRAGRVRREARRLAQEAVPGLEPRFVLYPAGSDGGRTSRPS